MFQCDLVFGPPGPIKQSLRPQSEMWVVDEVVDSSRMLGEKCRAGLCCSVKVSFMLKVLLKASGGTASKPTELDDVVSQQKVNVI